MSLQNGDYELVSITAAQPGWLSVWWEPTTSTGSVTMHGEPVGCWAIAKWNEDGSTYTEPVGLCPGGFGMTAVECDGQHIGYCGPDQDLEMHRPDVVNRILIRNRLANRGHPF